MQLPLSSVEDFQQVAKWITPDPPDWLARHFRDWSPTIFMSYAVETRQPTRSEMIDILNRVHESAGLLQRALNEPAVCEFLDAGGDRPMGPLVELREGLKELNWRSVMAAKLPAIAKPDGKAKQASSKLSRLWGVSY